METKQLKSDSHRMLSLLTISILVLSSPQVRSEKVDIHLRSTYCNSSTIQPQKAPEELTCYVNNLDARLLESNWNEIKSYKIIGGKSLMIEPQCHAEAKDLFISLTNNIRSKVQGTEHTSDCKVRLHLENSTATRLGDLFNLIDISESKVDDIQLLLGQFKIKENSRVGAIDIKVNDFESAITKSTVNTVKNLEFEGKSKVSITYSKLMEVEKFLYNTSVTSRIFITEIGGVAKHGFEIIQGTVNLENVTFGSLSAGSIIIRGGELIFTNVIIKDALPTSIVMEENCNIQFKNVNLGDEFSDMTFKINNFGNQTIYPLGLFFPERSVLSTTASLIIGFVIGSLLCLIVFFIIYRCCKGFTLTRSNKKREKDSFELTTTSARSPATDVAVTPTTPPPAPEPSATVSAQKGEAHDYDYFDLEEPSIEIPSQNMRINTPKPPNFAPPQPRPELPPLPSLPAPPLDVRHDNKDTTLNKGNDDYYIDIAEEEPIYEDCSDYEEKVDNSANLHRAPPQLTRINRDMENDAAVSFSKGEKTQLIQKPAGGKRSFLHTSVANSPVAKPPPPPRPGQQVTNSNTKPLRKVPTHPAAQFFEQNR